MWERPAQAECAVGTGGQANGEHGRRRASPHLQGQTGMQALVGRLGSTLAKGEGHRGWEVGARSLYAALGQSETRSWYGEKGGNHHHTPLQALMIPYSGRNTGVAMGVVASSTSAPLSSCPHVGLCILKGHRREWKRPGLLPRGAPLLNLHPSMALCGGAVRTEPCLSFPPQ